MVNAKNILITGYPGAGKTTLIIKLAQAIKHHRSVGFYTTEIRKQGIRQGFELAGLDGRRGRLAHVDIKSPVHVGKYGVDVAGFEKFIAGIDFFNTGTEYVIIDEIGKMECLSSRFQQLILKLLDSDKTLIATIAYKGPALISEIKGRSDVILMDMHYENKDHLFAVILQEIHSKPG